MLHVSVPATRPFVMRRCLQCGTEFDDSAEFCHLDGQRLDVEDVARADPYLGKTLFGQFEVEKVLGVGGMGTVYRARQREIDRPVAVKVLHPEFVRDADAAHRFKREARLASRIENPHLVTVYSFGELPDGNLCLVMEYLDGRHLAEVLHEAGGRLPPARVAHILGQVGDAVGEAHALGIVHRDLKPENVMVLRRSGDPDFVKVLDFGIAKQIDARSLATQHGLVFGTARYISPEGARGEKADSRSDVYSLGVMAYELLAGVPPFQAPNAMQLLLAHVQDTPPPLAAQPGAKDVPAAMVDLVLRCLAKDPAQRPPDARAFADAIRAAAGAPVRASREAAGIPSTLAGASSPDLPPVDEYAEEARAHDVPPKTARALPASPGESVPPELPVRRTRWAMAALVVLAAIGGIVFFATRGPSTGAQMSRLLRRAEVAFSEGRIGEADGAIALTDEALRASPDLPGALDLRRRMTLQLLERARQAEREGRLEAAIESLALYERLRPEDDATQAHRRRLEEQLHAGDVPVGELPPDAGAASTVRSPAPPPGQAIVEVQPARVFAGEVVTFVAIATGFGDAPLGASHFHVRLTGRSGAVAATVADAAPGGRPDEYTATHVFPEPGRYEVAFASHAGRRHVDGSTIVLVAARAAEPPPGPVTAAPEPVTGAPEPVTSAPDPETAAPRPEPETSAPPTESAAG